MAFGAGTSSDDQSIERVGQEYFKTLLEDIKIMLNYVNQNGIVVPDDLKQKISALFAGAETESAAAGAKGAA